jgi:thiamine-phosphate pyrophosphorylase
MAGGFWTLRRTAALLKRPAPERKGASAKARPAALPRLLVFTDPARTPDVEGLAARLPAEAALVYRAFGAPDAEAVARRLLKRVRARRGMLLIGADAALAARIGADGVHLPERAAGRARALKTARPDWLVTAAAHGPGEVRAARAAGADAAVVSAVFPSRSPSAGTPMGPVRFARIVRCGGLPVYALGGVSDATAGRLRDLPLAGLAAVEGFRT